MIMRKLIAILLLSLAGCATGSGQYGNFSEATPAINQKMANDTIVIVNALYPPAATRLNMLQPAMDGYGAYLVALLRAKGYAVAELKTRSGWIWDWLQTPAENKPAATGTDFHYIVSQTGINQFVLTLHIGPQTLSRIYTAQGDKLSPSGFWVRKE